jgi:regulator of protease activity HflC (stomatin/prohibitin superfamily)
MSFAVAMTVLLLLSGGALAAGVRRVPAGTVCTVHRFGRYVRTLRPGLNVTWPLIDQIAHRVNLIGHQIDLSPPADSACGATVYFQILEPEWAGEALEEVDSMVEREARRRLTALVRCEAGEVAGIAARLKQELNTQLGVLGLRVTRCQLRSA